MALVKPLDFPWANLYERQADEAFNVAESATADQLRALRPPLPQIQYLPPRFGYPTFVERQWTVMQVFGIDRTPTGRIPSMPERRQDDRVDYSRTQAGQSGSDRNMLFDPMGTGGGGTG